MTPSWTVLMKSDKRPVVGLCFSFNTSGPIPIMKINCKVIQYYSSACFALGLL